MATRYKPRRKSWGGGRPKTWTVDGWTGMYDSRAHGAEADGDAPLLFNLLPTDIVRKGPVYVRPGRETLARAATAPLIGSGAHDIQWIGEITLAIGGTRTIAISDGEIVEVNTTTGVLTTRVTTAQLTAAACPIGLNVCQCIVFNATLVVLPIGANRPFTWDGTAGAGLVSLTNAPALALTMTVYYAKLFFVKNAAPQTTIVWSEENQANTGYEAGGYNNAWNLTQSSGESLTAILGTNEALYYSRRNSVGAIRGAVTASFATDGVQDGIHLGSGAIGNAVFTYCGNTLFWTDQKGQTFAYRAGGPVTNITSQLPRLFGTEAFKNPANNTTGQPVYGVGEDTLGGTQMQLHVSDQANQRLYVEAGASTARFVLVFDVATLKLLSLWSFGSTNPPGASNGPFRKIYACIATTPASTALFVYVSSSGHVFQHVVGGLSVPAITADYDNTGAAVAVNGILLGPMHGWSPTTEWQFTQLDVLIDQLDTTSTSVGYLTSRQHKVSLTPADQTVAASGVADDPYEKRVAVGINANGRWCRPIISLTGSTSVTAGRQPPMLYGYTLTGYPVSGGPSVS